LFRIHKGLTCRQTVCNIDYDTSELRLFKESSRELVPAAWGAKSTMISNRYQGCNQPISASLVTDSRSRQARTRGPDQKRTLAQVQVYFVCLFYCWRYCGVCRRFGDALVTLTMLLHAQPSPRIHDLRCKAKSC